MTEGATAPGPRECPLDWDRLSPGQIRRRLALAPSLEQEVFPAGFFPQPPAPAAVLVPLYRHRNSWRLLFIRRADHPGDRHGGQVAFPGGRVEPEDLDAVAAALREAQEEVGLAPSQVRVLGSLGAYRTVSNFLVTPVVGLIPWPLALAPDPGEVSRIFGIPLAWLGQPGRHRLRVRTLGVNEAKIPVAYFEPYEGEVLWGVSARITLGLLAALEYPSQP